MRPLFLPQHTLSPILSQHTHPNTPFPPSYHPSSPNLTHPPPLLSPLFLPLALGEAVVCAPSSSLNAPDLDELPEVQVPIFDLDILLPKWSLSYPTMIFPTMEISAGDGSPNLNSNPSFNLHRASPPMQVVSMRIKKATPFPTPMVHPYRLTYTHIDFHTHIS